MPEAQRARALDLTTFAERLRDDAPGVLNELRCAARKGNVEAQALHAQMHCEGRGVPRDMVEGLHWYTLAASSGHVRSMNMVGRCHELGQGTAPNPELAAAWYRKAVAQGLDWGMYNLANLLATARGVRENRSEAFALYRRAAELGHAKSMNLVGRNYEEGWEVTCDPAAALDWYRRSALAGDFRGQASYAAILTQSGRVGEAAYWLQRAAETGTPAFLEKLGSELAGSAHAELRALGAKLRARAASTSKPL